MASSFTPLEMDILECLASSWSLEDICRELQGTPEKIRTYIARIRKKLDITLDKTADLTEQYTALCENARRHFQAVQYYTFSLPAEEAD